jgi:SAM-dependent methyltransferase
MERLSSALERHYITAMKRKVEHWSQSGTEEIVPEERSRKRRKAGCEGGEWFREAFTADYIRLYAHRDEAEAERQVRAAVRLVPFVKGQKILDIACGPGRHLLAFAKRGARVSGIDLSKPLLKIARQKMREAGIRASLRHGDMRELPYVGEFDGVTIWFTSLGYFRTMREDRLVIAGMAKALKPGGWWWLDLANPGCVEKHLVPCSRWTTDGPHGPMTIIEERMLINQRVEKTVQIRDARGVRRYRERVRLYRPEQVGALIASARLTADGIVGDYDGRALTHGSPRQIWYGRKPDGR